METPRSEASSETTDFSAALVSHKRWLKSVLGLGALEAKLWVASSAQLLGLMCAVIFLLMTAWLLIIATCAVIAWSYGFPLIGILVSATCVTLLSALVLLYCVKRTLRNMNFTRTLDTIIPTAEE